MSFQQNLVTAQGRTDPNQKTGTSIQNCWVIRSPDLIPMAASTPTYSGRPWKNFSRTVHLQSYIDAHINPKGCRLEWDGNFALDTLYYHECENEGPRSGLAGRVSWTGYNVITDPEVAKSFTAAELIQGGMRFGVCGVAYVEGPRYEMD
ncbi:uncharacterized protein A4U43_C03F9790 [Asparagus officinalis]|uniref:Pectinesterase catalytic domain-containing protein n=2 Tax=Asparagus officinalis TaxID=4686 RepID=A0A5P1F9B8_ASPOF|nr:uncharacterized protein A4U43_C03F9790 [Asparagus officinalis]